MQWMIVLLALIFFAISANAQTVTTKKGAVEYTYWDSDKKINLAVNDIQSATNDEDYKNRLITFISGNLNRQNIMVGGKQEDKKFVKEVVKKLGDKGKKALAEIVKTDPEKKDDDINTVKAFVAGR